MHHRPGQLALLALVLAAPPAWALSGNAQITLASQGRYDALAAGLEQDARKKPLRTPDLHALCYAYSKLKRYDTLLSCLDQLDRQIAAGDSESRLFGLDDATPSAQLMRAEASIDLGQYRSAASQAQQALDWYRREHSNDLDIRFQALADQVIALRLAGDRKGAAARLDELEASGLGLTGGSYRGARAIALARANMAMGRYQAVLDALDSDFTLGLRRFFDNLNTGALFSGSQNWLWLDLPRAFMAAQAHLELGHRDEARKGLDAILAIPQASQNGEIFWLSLQSRGRIAVADGDKALAERCWQRAIDVIEKYRSSINTEANKIGFVGDKMSVYDALIDLQVSQGKAGDALVTAERAKSRALVDLLAERQDFSPPPGTRAEDIRAALARLRQAEARARWQSDSETGSGSELEAARASLEKLAPGLDALVAVRSPGLAEVRRLLQPGETLLLYHLSPGQLHAFTLTADRVAVQSFASAGLAADIADLRQDLAEQSPAADTLLRKLYERLIPDDLAPAKAPGKLLIVPHKSLHYVPFAALRGPKGYLLEQWAIRVLPSAGLLPYLPPARTGYGDNLVILGNPDLGDASQDLPSAEQEARAIASQTGSTHLLLRAEASKSALRAAATEATALHVASHGEFRGDHPMESALFLAPDQRSDGRLTVADLYQLRLNARLVVLSACETGLGSIASGDDVVGLVRGFLYAGAGAIVSSLWQVDDSATSELMTDFYTRLPTSGSRDAMRQAQLDLRARHPHPFFWSAFFVTGATP
ncbi:MAG: CHAT domain-containing protein [Perlucidibaca sp.]